MVNVGISESRVAVDLGYWTGSLSPWQATNVAETFSKIISACLDTPDTILGELSFLSNRDLEQTLGWNGTQFNPPQSCVHDVIRDQYVQRPHAPAVHSWDGQLSYHQLEAHSNSLAHHLKSLGVGSNHFVPLCFEKSMWMIVSILAVMKAGAAFVPLDPSHPKSRLEGIARQVEAHVVLSSPLHEEMCANTADTVVVVAESTVATFDDRFDHGRKLDINPSDAVFCIFTSGSTGKPTPLNIINHVQSY